MLLSGDDDREANVNMVLVRYIGMYVEDKAMYLNELQNVIGRFKDGKSDDIDGVHAEMTKEYGVGVVLAVGNKNHGGKGVYESKGEK